MLVNEPAAHARVLNAQDGREYFPPSRPRHACLLHPLEYNADVGSLCQGI